MKKTVYILLLALRLSATAACAASQSEPTAQPLPTAEPTADQPVADDSGTDLYMPGDEGYMDDSPTDAADRDYTALAAEDCVEDA